MNEVSSTEPTVLLLDNPGLELHPDGQRDIKRSIEEKHSAGMQVIYVTHSPAMIDPHNLEQVRTVELQEYLNGTKVCRLDVKNGKQFDLLEPVRSAVGASLITSLMTNQFTILAEGAADQPILAAALSCCAPSEMKDKVLVTGSVAETDLLPSFLERARLPYAVYVDSDSSGRDIEGRLKSASIPSDKIIPLKSAFSEDVFPGADFELEDMISSSFYDKAFKETYPDKPLDIAQDDKPKRTKRYEDEFRKKYRNGFSKRRVAEKIKQIALREGFDEASKTNMQKIVDKLLETLKKQVAQ